MRGQVRIAAAVMAVAIVVAAYSLASRIVRPVKSLYYRESEDLERLAYNVLDSMASAHVFDELILSDPAVLEAITSGRPVNCSAGEPVWADKFRALLAAALPGDVSFTARVGYYHQLSNGSLAYYELHCAPISLGEARFTEAASVTYTYTTSGGGYGVVILRIDLVVGRGG